MTLSVDIEGGGGGGGRKDWQKKSWREGGLNYENHRLSRRGAQFMKITGYSRGKVTYSVKGWVSKQPVVISHGHHSCCFSLGFSGGGGGGGG